MNLKKFLIICSILFALSTIEATAFIFKNKTIIQSDDYIKNYLYSSILYDENKHNLAAKNLDKINELTGRHIEYDIKYISSLVISGKLSEAAKVISETEKIYSGIFLFDFIRSVNFLKQKKYKEALIEIKKIKSNDLVFQEFQNSLIFWIEIRDKSKNQFNAIKKFKSRNLSIGLINKFLSSRYIEDLDLYNYYNKKILNSNELIRYQIFSAWNEKKIGNNKKALSILEYAFINDDRNLLLKQSIVDFNKNNNQVLLFFDPKKFEDNIAEIFYLFSNLYMQRDDDFSKLLLSLSLKFNERFLSNHLASFENHIIENNLERINYLSVSKLKNIGTEYKWYVNYQMAVQEEKKNINFLEKTIVKNDLFLKDKYFDLANYFRVKKNYELALDYYKRIENMNLDLDWSFYYYVGICYERLKNWELSEKNLKKSLSLSPKEYSVINYLAYSWLERNKNINEATRMLEDAVKLSKWELGYIIDSLGWAYFLQKDFNKAEKLLKIAYEKVSSESEVYDHYGDVLWMNNKYLQARYVWKNALNLENIDPEREKRIKDKIVNGLKISE
ncbi:tetratricopeptide repeat protein [Candidatus Pelagibacter sp. HIMB109]|uniref:tetratricopeptide repeat protein n=1 Tax=Candidatus Pelagibacter sp. HIMB109 TaxID=3415412 RepID=UPI003F8435EE